MPTPRDAHRRTAAKQASQQQIITRSGEPRRGIPACTQCHRRACAAKRGLTDTSMRPPRGASATRQASARSGENASATMEPTAIERTRRQRGRRPPPPGPTGDLRVVDRLLQRAGQLHGRVRCRGRCRVVDAHRCGRWQLKGVVLALQLHKEALAHSARACTGKSSDPTRPPQRPRHSPRVRRLEPRGQRQHHGRGSARKQHALTVCLTERVRECAREAARDRHQVAIPHPPTS